MKRDTLILLVALVCGVAAFGLIFNFLKQAAQPKNQFVAARQVLTKGKILTAEDLVLSPPMKNVKAADFYTQMHEVIGMELQNDLGKGKLVGRKQVKKAPPAKVAAVQNADENEETIPVPPSMRALTLSTGELENVPRMVAPGSYVDVLGTVIFGNNQREVRTILHGVQILGFQKSAKNVMESVTMAVPPAQVETLLNASKFGKLRLVASSGPGDSSVWSNVGSIEIIRGTQKERKVT